MKKCAKLIGHVSLLQVIEGSQEVIDLKFGFGDPLFLHHLEDTADKLGKKREGWEGGNLFSSPRASCPFYHFKGLAKRSAREISLARFPNRKLNRRLSFSQLLQRNC